MCGIAGIIHLNAASVDEYQLKKMTDAIAHRGPDGEGFWTSAHKQVALGHRRLSIIDLSDAGAQPMHFLNRYHIVYNGEIYNYIELKEDLEKQGYKFNSESDTEVLLAMFDRYKEACLEKLDGMFSFLIYDEQEKCVFAACDRFGEKPFFYNYIPGKHFVFASEMKGLWAKGVEKTVNNRMLFNYLAHGYVLNSSDLSETFYEGCTRLPHSHFLKMNLSDGKVELKKYYDINHQDTDESISFNQAKDTLQELLYTSVKRRLRSDVSMGNSLSGGLDSSIIVSIVDELLNYGSTNSKKGSTSVQTFSVRFPGFIKDEGKYIDILQQARNLNAHSITPSADSFVKSWDELCHFQEEPFGDAGIFLQYEVMRLAKNSKVKVILDGQGADEIFAGYQHYFPVYFRTLERKDKKTANEEYQFYVDLHKGNSINKLYKRDIEYYLRGKFENQLSQAKRWKLKLKQIGNHHFNSNFYNAYSHEDFKENNWAANNLNEALYHQAFCGDLQMRLRFSDRNSMAHGREVRLPFLNHELVDFLFKLPVSFKIHKGWTKYILRESFKTVLPESIVNRVDKIGYEAPDKNWMEELAFVDKLKRSEAILKENQILHHKFNLQQANDHEKTLMNWRILMGAML